jgi:hypothetical protein
MQVLDGNAGVSDDRPAGLPTSCRMPSCPTGVCVCSDLPGSFGNFNFFRHPDQWLYFRQTMGGDKA